MKCKCPQCGFEMEVDKILADQAMENNEAILAKKYKEMQGEIEKSMKERFSKESEEAAAKIRSEQKDMIGLLQKTVEEGDKRYQELVAQMGELMKANEKEKKARMDAELEAAKKYDMKREQDIKEAIERASEHDRLKIKELEKTLEDTKNAAKEAVKKGEQGSQQTQGEVIELDLESACRQAYPIDNIEEVKKGEKGADIKVHVRNELGKDCGLVLVESKNAKWDTKWIGKAKKDKNAAEAATVVIATINMPEEFSDIQEVDGVWVVRLRLFIPFLSVLRSSVIQAQAASENVSLLSDRAAYIVRYISGDAFRNRVEAMIKSYNDMLHEIDLDRKNSELRWSKMERSLRTMMGSTNGMYGDFQGILGSTAELPALPEVARPSEED